MTRYADHTTAIADILGTTVVEGEVRADLGYWGGQSEDSPGIAKDAPVWTQFGFVSRPADPDEDGAAMAVYEPSGDQTRVRGTRDLRMAPKLPDLRPGEAMAFGFSGNFTRYHQDGRVTTMTTDDTTPEGRAIFHQISPSDGLIFESPWARITAGPSGIHMLHKPSGCRFDMGSIGGLPGPLAALTAYAQLSTPGILKLEGAAVSVGGGPTPGLANEVSVIALQTYMTAVNTFAAAVGVIVAGLAPASGATAPMLATFATALTALQTAGNTAAAAVINLGKPI